MSENGEDIEMEKVHLHHVDASEKVDHHEEHIPMDPELAAMLEAKKQAEAEIAKNMLEAAAVLREEIKQEEEEISVLKGKQEVRLKRRAVEMERLAELMRQEEKRRKEEEAEKKRIKDEEKRKRKEEKERKQREKEERAKKKGMKNFSVKKSETSSLSKYESAQEQPAEMAKSKEQMEEEKRAALSQRIVPLDLSGLDTQALIAKAKELHDILYKLESDKYDLDDRYKRQQYDMMELAERARQMNKGGKTAATADGGFDRLAEKFPNVPPKVAVCSKYDRQTDKRSFGERANIFKKAGSNSKAKQEDGPSENGEPAPTEDAPTEE